MKLGLHTGGKKSQKAELRQSLNEQIKATKGALNLSDAEKKIKIANLKLKYREDLKNMDYNLY
ncbi:MAG: hypothetical protein AAGF89_13115 [Bacteroidota bacterium]